MILVIGSQGFIGSHIVQHFLSQGFEVLGCDLVEFSTEKYYYQKISILSSDFAKLFLENTFDIFNKFRINNILRRLLIFIFVSVAWIFFRSQNFEQAYGVIQNLVEFKFDFRLNQLSALKSPYNLFLCLLSILLLYVLEKVDIGFLRKNLLLFFVVGTLLLILFGISNEAQFIYFQF